ELGREGRCEAVRSHPLEPLAHLALDLVELGGVDALRLELGAEDDDRIALPPAVELAFGPVRTRIASRVAHEAVRQRLAEHAPLPPARVRHRVPGSLAHGPHAHAVDRLGRDAHDLGASAYLSGSDGAERRVLAVAVVLADEHDRQAEDLCEVEALE